MNRTIRSGLLALFLCTCPPAFAETPPDTQPSILRDYTHRDATAEEIPALQQLAKQGNGLAQLILGRAYFNQEGVPFDRQKGQAWLLEAARNGHAPDVKALAEGILLGMWSEENRGVAYNLMAAACEAGDPDACGLPGFTYLEEGMEQQGLALLKRGAQGGAAYAMFQYGQFLLKGSATTPANPTEGFQWLRRSADQGYIYAYVAVGRCYEQGSGTPQDFQSARAWYEKGAAVRDLSCSLALAELYEYGRGFPQDSQKALDVYKAIALSGTINAHERIGTIYEEGRGVPQDFQEAFKWYDQAKMLLNAQHAYRLGMLCEEGKVVPRNIPKAREYFEQSRTPEACHRLGLSYQDTAPKDLEKAYTWFEVARIKGEPRATANLAALERRLSSAAISKAKAAAQEWIEFDSH